MAGGGVSHRAGLYDAILVKENHAALAGGVGEAARRAVAGAEGADWVEVEIERPDQLRGGAGRRRRSGAAGQHGARRAARVRARWPGAGRPSRRRAACRSTPCGRSPRPAWTSSASARSPTAPRRSTCRCCSSRCSRRYRVTVPVKVSRPSPPLDSTTPVIRPPPLSPSKRLRPFDDLPIAALFHVRWCRGERDRQGAAGGSGTISPPTGPGASQAHRGTSPRRRRLSRRWWTRTEPRPSSRPSR